MLWGEYKVQWQEDENFGKYDSLKFENLRNDYWVGRFVEVEFDKNAGVTR